VLLTKYTDFGQVGGAEGLVVGPSGLAAGAACPDGG
jgi:hypothetical protein